MKPFRAMALLVMVTFPMAAFSTGGTPLNCPTTSSSTDASWTTHLTVLGNFETFIFTLDPVVLKDGETCKELEARVDANMQARHADLNRYVAAIRQSAYNYQGASFESLDEEIAAAIQEAVGAGLESEIPDLLVQYQINLGGIACDVQGFVDGLENYFINVNDHLWEQYQKNLDAVTVACGTPDPEPDNCTTVVDDRYVEKSEKYAAKALKAEAEGDLDKAAKYSAKAEKYYRKAYVYSCPPPAECTGDDIKKYYEYLEKVNKHMAEAEKKLSEGKIEEYEKELAEAAKDQAQADYYASCPTTTSEGLTCSDIKDITALTMQWDGADGVNVETATGETFTGINNGDIITFAASKSVAGNDFPIHLSGAVDGISVFHLSCSDSDMNGADDCGRDQGNGKGNDDTLVNDWRLGGMTGERGTFSCF